MFQLAILCFNLIPLLGVSLLRLLGIPAARSGFLTSALRNKTWSWNLPYSICPDVDTVSTSSHRSSTRAQQQCHSFLFYLSRDGFLHPHMASLADIHHGILVECKVGRDLIWAMGDHIAQFGNEFDYPLFCHLKIVFF